VSYSHVIFPKCEVGRQLSIFILLTLMSYAALHYVQSDHSPAKPGKVREFQSGQGKVRENGKSQGKVREVKSGVFFSSSKYSETRFFGRGSAPDPAGGAYNAPQTP